MSKFEEMIKLKELFLQCPKCNKKVPITWEELEDYVEIVCICKEGILLTNDDYKKMKEFEKEVCEAEIEDGNIFDGLLKEFFANQPEGKFKTDGDGRLEIEIDGGITDDDRNL